MIRLSWKALEEAVAERKVLSIGISNFDEERILKIIEEGNIIPQVDQIECHPYFQQHSLRKLLDEYHIQVESFYPVGHEIGDGSKVGNILTAVNDAFNVSKNI